MLLRDSEEYDDEEEDLLEHQDVQEFRLSKAQARRASRAAERTVSFNEELTWHYYDPASKVLRKKNPFRIDKMPTFLDIKTKMNLRAPRTFHRRSIEGKRGLIKLGLANLPKRPKLFKSRHQRPVYGDETDDSCGSDSGRTSGDEDDEDTQDGARPGRRHADRPATLHHLQSAHEQREPRRRSQTAAARRRRRRREYRRLMKRAAGVLGINVGKLSSTQIFGLASVLCLLALPVFIFSLSHFTLVPVLLFPGLAPHATGIPPPSHDFEDTFVQTQAATTDAPLTPRIRISSPACPRRNADGPCMVAHADSLVFWTHNFQAVVDGRRQVWLDNVLHDIDAGAKASHNPPTQPDPRGDRHEKAPHRNTVSSWWPAWFSPLDAGDTHPTDTWNPHWSANSHGAEPGLGAGIEDDRSAAARDAAVNENAPGGGGSPTVRPAPHPQKVTIPISGLSLDEVHNLTVVLATPQGQVMAADMVLFAIPSSSPLPPRPIWHAQQSKADE